MRRAAVRTYVTEFSKQDISLYKDFNEAQLRHYYEPERGVFIAESGKVISRALDAGMEPLSFLIAKERIAEAEEMFLSAHDHDVPVYVSPEKELRGITGYNLTGGMLCAMRRPILPEVQTVYAHASRIAVVVDVVNPTNIGAVIRSAAALGIDAVLLSYSCSDPLERRALRVSMGTAFQIPWTYIDKAADINDTLHELGFKTAAMALADDAISLASNSLKETDKLAIMIGNEGNGLPTDVIERADHKVIIPMYNGVDSLNAAAASAVAFWELRKDSINGIKI
jgi:tRNA G18 (ribose-2'-O)-methylase SpoU